jgi:hypothetical protein
MPDDEPFQLTGVPKIAAQKFPYQPGGTQRVLFCGLDDSPGQENLFETDGPPAPTPAKRRPVAVERAEPGDIILPAQPKLTLHPGRPAWLLFMKGLTREDARKIAREEGGKAFSYGNRWAVIVPELE